MGCKENKSKRAVDGLVVSGFYLRLRDPWFDSCSIPTLLNLFSAINTDKIAVLPAD